MKWRSQRREAFAWTRWFVIIATISGVALVFVTPVLGGTDEVAHVSRVALIAEGHVIPPTSRGPSPGYRTDPCITSYVKAYQLQRYFGARSSWTGQFHNGRCDVTDRTLATSSRTADFYTPIPYAPALVGFWTGRVVHGPSGSVYGARLFQLAAYIALMGFALSRAPWGRPLLFTIGLLPVSIGGAASVSADPMTLALACVIVVSILRALQRARTREVLSRGEWWILGGACLALALSKSAYVPFALLILTIPTVVFADIRRRLMITTGILGSAALVSGAWNLGVAAHVSVVGINGSDSIEAARIIKDHPRGFLQSIGRGWQWRTERVTMLGGLFSPVRRFARSFPLPILPGLVWLFVARVVEPIPRFIMRIRDRRVGPDAVHPVDPDAARSDSDVSRTADLEARSVPLQEPISASDRSITFAVTLTVALATILLTEYGLALAANPPGASRIVWVQGRYFLPLLPLTLIGFHRTDRMARGRWLLVFPIVNTGVVLWWMWWASGNVWNWW